MRATAAALQALAPPDVAATPARFCALLLPRRGPAFYFRAADSFPVGICQRWGQAHIRRPRLTLLALAQLLDLFRNEVCNATPMAAGFSLSETFQNEKVVCPQHDTLDGVYIFTRSSTLAEGTSVLVRVESRQLMLKEPLSAFATRRTQSTPCSCAFASGLELRPPLTRSSLGLLPRTMSSSSLGSLPPLPSMKP